MKWQVRVEEVRTTTVVVEANTGLLARYAVENAIEDGKVEKLFTEPWQYDGLHVESAVEVKG